MSGARKGCIDLESKLEQRGPLARRRRHESGQRHESIRGHADDRFLTDVCIDGLWYGYGAALPGALVISSMLVGVCYGSQWLLIPSITSEILGIKHFGTIFNISPALWGLIYYLCELWVSYMMEKQLQKAH